MASDLHNITSPIARATAAAPTITEADVAGLSIDLAGNLRTVAGASSVTIGSVLIIGAATLATAQATCDSTVDLLVAARTGRRAVTLTNHTTTAFYYGPTGITTATGSLLLGIIGASVTLETSAAVYGITASGTATVGIAEVY